MDLDTQASTGMAPNAVALTLYFRQGRHRHRSGRRVSRLGGRQERAAAGQLVVLGLRGSTGRGPDRRRRGVVFTGNPKQTSGRRRCGASSSRAAPCSPRPATPARGCPAAAIVLNGVTLLPTPWMGYPAIQPNAVAWAARPLFNDATALAPASRALEYTWNYTGGGSSLFLAAGQLPETPTRPSCSPAARPIRTALHTPRPRPARLSRRVAQSGDIATNGYQITVGWKKTRRRRHQPLVALWLGNVDPIQAAASRKRQWFANYAFTFGPAQPGVLLDIGRPEHDTWSTANGQYCSHLAGTTPPLGNARRHQSDDGPRRTDRATRVTTPNPPDITPSITGTTCPGPQIVDGVKRTRQQLPGGRRLEHGQPRLRQRLVLVAQREHAAVTMTSRPLDVPAGQPGRSVLGGVLSYNRNHVLRRAQNTGPRFTLTTAPTPELQPR